MEELVDEGLTRNIGLSNVQGSLLLDVLRYARIQPQALQVEIHPYLSQEPLVQLAKRHGIAVTAYSSFGPAVSQRTIPEPQHDDLMRMVGQGYIELSMDQGAASLFEHDVVAGIAKARSKSRPRNSRAWGSLLNII